MPGSTAPHTKLEEGRISSLMGYRLAQVVAITNALFDEAVQKKYQIRPVELTILELLHANPDATPTQLAKALTFTMPSLTIWFDKLEKKELIQRTRNPIDKRSMKILLTPKGKKVVNGCVAALLDADQIFDSKISKTEQHTLLNLLDKAARVRTSSRP
jgi:DNA-binding MarR family transcriptional regulator